MNRKEELIEAHKVNLAVNHAIENRAVIRALGNMVRESYIYRGAAADWLIDNGLAADYQDAEYWLEMEIPPQSADK